MPKLTSEIIGRREKFLLYGPPKRGKTFCALTAPEPIFFLAIGGPNEAKTYFSADFQQRHGTKEIWIETAVEKVGKMGRYKHPEGFDNASIILDKFLELDDQGKMETSTGGFETLIVDNATILQEYMMNKVIYIADTNRNPDAKGASTHQTFMEHGILKPHDADWGAAQGLMRDWYSWLFAIDKHIVFVAHEKEITHANRATQSSDLIAIKPLFVGQQRNIVANRFDNVWHFYKQGPMYVARTVPEDKPIDIIAGTRLGGIVSPDYQNPDLTKTIAKFKKHAEEIERGEAK